MRAVFGVLSLLVVVAIVGILVKKQLGVAAPATGPASSGIAGETMAAPSGTPKQQVQQFQQAVQGVVQQARPVPDDK